MPPSECDRCQLYSGSAYLPCAVHPSGPAPDGCLDFTPNAGAIAQKDDGLWQPLGASYYGGELIQHRPSHLTREEQFELLDYHPLFTGCCPDCGWLFDQNNSPGVHWDCPCCGWIDDTV